MLITVKLNTAYFANAADHARCKQLDELIDALDTTREHRNKHIRIPHLDTDATVHLRYSFHKDNKQDGFATLTITEDLPCRG